MMTVPAAAQNEEAQAQTGQEAPNPAVGWGPQDGTPGVRLEIREVGRERRDDYTEVTLQIHVQGAPMGKTYNLWLQDLGMFVSDLPPAPLKFGDAPVVEFSVDEDGVWDPGLPRITLDRFVMGEWTEWRLVSTDGSVRAMDRFAPFPIAARDGPCRVELVRLSRRGRIFLVTGEGFAPGEMLEALSSVRRETIAGSISAEPDGTLPTIFLAPEFPRIRRKDPATYTVIGELCKVVVEYDIGRVAFDEFQ